MSKMVGWIDDSLMQLAKKMVQAAAFFGISRWRLIVGWIWLSQLSYCYGWVKSAHLGAIGAVITLGVIPSGLTLLVWLVYREDDILSPFLIGFKNSRVFYVTVPQLIAIFSFGLRWISHRPDWDMLYLLFPPMFFLYLLFQQTPKNPFRLRKVLKNLASKAQAALRPSPRRAPEVAHAYPRPLPW